MALALRHYVNPVRHKFWTTSVAPMNPDPNEKAAAHPRDRESSVGPAARRGAGLDRIERGMAEGRPCRGKVLSD